MGSLRPPAPHQAPSTAPTPGLRAAALWQHAGLTQTQRKNTALQESCWAALVRGRVLHLWIFHLVGLAYIHAGRCHHWRARQELLCFQRLCTLGLRVQRKAPTLCVRLLLGHILIVCASEILKVSTRGLFIQGNADRTGNCVSVDSSSICIQSMYTHSQAESQIHTIWRTNDYFANIFGAQVPCAGTVRAGCRWLLLPVHRELQIALL